MPSLITQPDGSVRWDYDLPDEPKKAAKKAATSTATKKAAKKAATSTATKKES